MRIRKYDVVSGWFGIGTVLDIAEYDTLVGIRQGQSYRFVERRDIEKVLDKVI